jgi:hypothetical protein
LPEFAKSKEIHLSANMPRLLGPNGLSGAPASCGAKQASSGGAGPYGPKSEEYSFSKEKLDF